MKTKLCPVERSGCGVRKRLSQFHKNPNNRDGLSNICGDCINKKHRIQKQDEKKRKLKQAEIENYCYQFVGINPQAARKAMKNDE